MSIKFLLSEFSPKVKAYNSIEENILRRRLDIYQREQRASVRMIEKDLKNFQHEQDKRSYLMKTLSTSNSLLSKDNDGNNNDFLPVNEQQQRNGVSDKRTYQKRHQNKRKKRQHKLVNDRDEYQQQSATNETRLFKPHNERNSLKTSHSATVQETKNFFLPKLKFSHTKHTPNNHNEPIDYFTLPPIGKVSLTSSVPLPNIHVKMPKLE